MKNRKKVFQVTCKCSAYSFPHRLSSGKCDGSEWAKHAKISESREECESCNCNQNGSCDVANGAESVKHCEVFQEISFTNEYVSWPEDILDTYQEMYENYYE